MSHFKGISGIEFHQLQYVYLKIVSKRKTDTCISNKRGKDSINKKDKN